MDSGSLNRRVTFQKMGETFDDFGQPVAGWMDHASAWANIRNLSGLESIKAGADVSVVKTSIRIRYRKDITAGMRIVAGTTIYDITAVLPDEQTRDRMDLSCEVTS